MYDHYKSMDDVPFPSMEDTVEGGQQDRDGAYTTFCEYILPAVIGKANWILNCRTSYLTNYITPTDEGLALIMLENNWERWIDECRGVDIRGYYRKTKVHM